VLRFKNCQRTIGWIVINRQWTSLLKRAKAISLVIIIGDIGVGKTLLVNRIMDKQISEQNLPTVSVEFSTKEVQLPNGKRMRVELWDTGKYSSLSRLFVNRIAYRGSGKRKV
jgi:hypothetical protein